MRKEEVFIIIPIMYLLVIKQLTTMLIIMAVGFIFARALKVDEKEQKFLSKLLLYMINPLMAFNSFNMEFDSSKLKQFIFVVLVSFCVHIVMIALAFLTTLSKKPENLEFNELDRVGVVFTNCGFMGIPLIRGVFGDEGVFFLMGYLVVFNILLWTWGYYQVSGGVNLKKIITNPNIIAVFLGIIVFCCPFTIPEGLARPFKMIGDVNTVVAMLLLGILLAGFKKPESMIFVFKIIKFCFVRLVLCSIINLVFLFVVYKIFGWMPDAKLMIFVVYICSLCPAATSVPSLACVFEKNATYASMIVSITSVLCMVTIPAFVALAELFIK